MGHRKRRVSLLQQQVYGRASLDCKMTVKKMLNLCCIAVIERVC